MATLYEMQSALKNYYNLKENLGYIVNYINNCINDLQISIDNCLNAYSVDEASKGCNELLKVLNELKEKQNTIKNSIIPSVNFEISKLKKKIEEEQAGLT